MMGIWINSLWPGDAIWQHRSGSTLDQVMACCLKATSHYLNQCWLIINGFWGIHIGTVTHEILMMSICKMSLKITFLKLLLHLPGTIELSNYIHFIKYALFSSCFVLFWFCNQLLWIYLIHSPRSFICCWLFGTNFNDNNIYLRKCIQKWCQPFCQELTKNHADCR